ncbi:pentapeptide repeat-containing protein [Streptomyces sp. NPDC046925]|uniref:pentapeptide repeat-containing protein n=1 Tax=Streptomyces sp. NPDC046925 TaxID=3155375 RepID=UPI0033C18830
MGQFRLAVVQVIAAIGAGIALSYTARTFRLSRRGQVTDRFTKALERLSSDEPYVRIGGILAMEQIVQDAPEQSGHAARVLNSFVRKHAPASSTEVLAASQLPEQPKEEVQEALRALTAAALRRGHHRDPVDLSNLHLKGALLRGAHLRQALLTGTTLDTADLRDADIAGADLRDADLSLADMSTVQGVSAAQILEARKLRGCRLPEPLSSRSEISGRVSGTS